MRLPRIRTKVVAEDLVVELSKTVVAIGAIFGAADISGQKAERLAGQVKVSLRKAAKRAGLPDEYVELLLDVYVDLTRHVGEHWPMVKRLAHFPDAPAKGAQSDPASL